EMVVLLAGGTSLWLAIGAPALESSTARRDAFRDFAYAVVDQVPAGTSLVFYGEPVRAVIVYAGRSIPSVDREPGHLPPGGFVIAFGPAYQALEEAGLVGPALARATGRIGNLARGELVLARVQPAAAGRIGTARRHPSSSD